jgi:hypothetical protein
LTQCVAAFHGHDYANNAIPSVVTCGGGGWRSSIRTILIPSSAGGMACPPSANLTRHKQCTHLPPCPADCETGAWVDWSPCTQTCGSGGSQSRHRPITSPAKDGGIACPMLEMTQACDGSGDSEGDGGGEVVGFSCPVDCEVSPWDSCSPCSHSCGGGSQLCQRSVTRRASHGGKACPALMGSRSCADAYCPLDCVMSKVASHARRLFFGAVLCPSYHLCSLPILPCVFSSRAFVTPHLTICVLLSRLCDSLSTSRL